MRISSASGMRAKLTGMRVSSCSVSATRYNSAAGLAGTSTFRSSLTTTDATLKSKIPANMIQRFISIAATPRDSVCTGTTPATEPHPER